MAVGGLFDGAVEGANVGGVVVDDVVGGMDACGCCWLDAIALSRSSVSFRRSINCLLKSCRRVASAYDVDGRMAIVLTLSLASGNESFCLIMHSLIFVCCFITGHTKELVLWFEFSTQLLHLVWHDFRQ